MFNNMLIYETMLYKKTMCTCMNNTDKIERLMHEPFYDGYCNYLSKNLIYIVYKITSIHESTHRIY